MQEATAIYTSGGHSKSYSTFAYAAGTAAAFASGATCTGSTSSGGSVSGTLKSAVSAGATSFSCVYDTSEVQASYQFCQVGGLPTASQVTSGCMVDSADITLGGTETLAAADLTLTGTYAGRTLQGFATASTNTGKERHAPFLPPIAWKPLNRPPPQPAPSPRTPRH